MNALREISGEDSAALLDLDAYDGRGKVLVFLLTEELLLPKIVDSHYLANACDQLARGLVECIGYGLAWCTVQQLQALASIRKPVGLDVAERTAALESRIQAHATEQIGLGLLSA